MKNKPFFSSWSGGKDACLALYRAIKAGAQPRFLFTMLEESDVYSRAHHLPVAVIEKQAEALGIPLITRAATWDAYERMFVDGLKEMKRSGVHLGVFGDIDLDDHLNWVEKTCQSVNIRSYHPLWKEERRHLIREFVDLGFSAKVIVVKEGVLPQSFLGKTFDRQLIEEIERLGVDACGEEGEFHTLVTDGPIFSTPLRLQYGEQLYHDGAWFQTVTI